MIHRMMKDEEDNEGLQRIYYNELEDLVEIVKIFICFCKNEIYWEQEPLTLEWQQ